MLTVQVVEAKAKFSSLLSAVEAGETVTITRHGRTIARLVPDTPKMASDAFRSFWDEPNEIDLTAPADARPDSVAEL
jgi:prevent-host-death family protein